MRKKLPYPKPGLAPAKPVAAAKRQTKPIAALDQLALELDPSTSIKCLSCDKDKPKTGSATFHAHHVCADCRRRLCAKTTKPEATP